MGWRLCVDYRRLNANTIIDVYAICRVDDNLDSLAVAKRCSNLDIHSAYFQVPLEEASREKTTFATPRNRLYEFTVMSVGLCNAPTTFSRIIEKGTENITITLG